MTWANNKLHCRLVYRHAYSEWRSEFGVLLIPLMKKANIYISPFCRPLNCFELFRISSFFYCKISAYPDSSNFKGIFIKFSRGNPAEYTPFVQLVAFQWIFCTKRCDSLDFALISFKLFKFNSRCRCVHKAIKYFASLKSMMVDGKQIGLRELFADQITQQIRFFQ